jgi:hypothetical protein
VSLCFHCLCASRSSRAVYFILFYFILINFQIRGEYVPKRRYQHSNSSSRRTCRGCKYPFQTFQGPKKNLDSALSFQGKDACQRTRRRWDFFPSLQTVHYSEICNDLKTKKSFFRYTRMEYRFSCQPSHPIDNRSRQARKEWKVSQSPLISIPSRIVNNCLGSSPMNTSTCSKRTVHPTQTYWPSVTLPRYATRHFRRRHKVSQPNFFFSSG